MTKIVIIADCIDNQNAGIHVYTKSMIDALEGSDKFELVCIRLKDDSRIAFKNQLVVPPVLPFLSKDPFRLFFTLPHAIRKLNPDIVIEPAHFGPFNLPKRIKRVTVIHDLTPIMFPHWHSFISSILQRLFLPSILRNSSLIITNSMNTSRDVIAMYPETFGKVRPVYPAIDPYFNLTGEDNIEAKRPFFLCVGTIEPRKNLSVLLDAYQLFRERTSYNYSMIICGSKGWKTSSFYKKLKKHRFRKDIQLQGYVSKEELKRLYSTTSAFIYPSLYEGFGLPVAEAMRCGAPCIVSNRSSLPEVGGDAAIYFNPEDKDELATKLTEVAHSKEMVMTLSKKSLIQASRFTGEQFMLELEKIFLALK